MFEGKNLVFVIAESFNEIAVSKELTPTLYKLINDGFNFKKITSNTGLLAQFNSLNRHLYSLNYGLMRAAVFLSQFKNTTQVFGRLNVLYAQGTKTVWTTDLIRTILSKGRYLIFSYANKKTPDFTATIGTEQLLKI